MGLFDNLFGNKPGYQQPSSGAIAHGGQKKDGSHDHRTNTGDDRTPAQKNGDKARTK